MAEKQIDVSAVEAEIAKDEQEKAKLHKELDEKYKLLADVKFGEVKSLLDKYLAHFSSTQILNLMTTLGASPAKSSKVIKQVKAPSTKPKKYKLPTGEEWSGQGGENMAPKAFRAWRANNPNKPWPVNPESKS